MSDYNRHLLYWSIALVLSVVVAGIVVVDESRCRAEFAGQIDVGRVAARAVRTIVGGMP